MVYRAPLAKGLEGYILYSLHSWSKLSILGKKRNGKCPVCNNRGMFSDATAWLAFSTSLLSCQCWLHYDTDLQSLRTRMRRRGLSRPLQKVVKFLNTLPYGGRFVMRSSGDTMLRHWSESALCRTRRPYLKA